MAAGTFLDEAKDFMGGLALLGVGRDMSRHESDMTLLSRRDHMNGATMQTKSLVSAVEPSYMEMQAIRSSPVAEEAIRGKMGLAFPWPYPAEKAAGT